jgi:hypothetical protein
MKKYIFVILLLAFVVGFALCLNPPIEPMTPMLSEEEELPNQCPNLLIKSGNRILLYHPDNQDPIVFKNLDQYKQYIHHLRSEGKDCPVLFLQEENDVQGNNVYRVRESPQNLGAGLPIQVMDATRDGNTYNKNQYAGFDSHGQHIGQYTSLDAIRDQSKGQMLSDNPMDTNWGGVLFSQKSVESGKYEDREVGKPRMVPKVLEIYK